MNKYRLEELLKDYAWKVNSVKLMRESLDSINFSGTAQYGIEATMPKAQDGPSDPILREVERRSERWEKIEQYEQELRFVQSRIGTIGCEREAEVLHWLLEGKSMRWIGFHMGLSDRHIGRIRDKIVSDMSRC